MRNVRRQIWQWNFSRVAIIKIILLYINKDSQVLYFCYCLKKKCCKCFEYLLPCETIKTVTHYHQIPYVCNVTGLHRTVFLKLLIFHWVIFSAAKWITFQPMCKQKIGFVQWSKLYRIETDVVQNRVLDILVVFVWIPFWFIPVFESTAYLKLQNCSMFPLAFVAGLL